MKVMSVKMAFTWPAVVLSMIVFLAPPVQCQGCNQNETLSLPSGTFTSPGFPQSYSDFMLCSWIIEADPDYIISLSFSEFELESCSNCHCDSVTVYDGSESEDPLLGQYCGTTSTLPSTIRSTGNTMYVVFKTDHSATYKGFSAAYQTQGCNVTLSQPSGKFTSPWFPQDYEDNTFCSWTIEADPNQVISLSFEEFQLEECGSRCGCDYVQVYDGSDSRDPLLGEYCTNTTLPNTIRSTGNTMYIVFVTDGSVTHKGFSAAYHTLGSPFRTSTTPTTVNPLIRFNHAYTRVRVECALIDREEDCSDIQDDLDYMIGRGFDEACDYLDTYTLCVTLRCENTFPFREALNDLQDVCAGSSTAKPPVAATVDPFVRYDFFTKYTDLRTACTLTDPLNDCSSEQADLDYKITHGWEETCDELPIYTLCMVLKCETSLRFRDALDGVHEMCDSAV